MSLNILLLDKYNLYLMSKRKASKTNKKVVKNIKKNLNKDKIYKERIEKHHFKHTAEELPLLINPEDTPQNPLTYQRLMDWLASTGWVYGYVRKRISPMDAHLYEDFAQHCWLAILTAKPERIMEIWHNGKGAFVNYIKRIIDIQLKSTNNPNYTTNKLFHHTHCTLSDEQWKHFIDGENTSSWVDTFPVKYSCPSGNRKKMVKLEYEELPIYVDPEYSLTQYE